MEEVEDGQAGLGYLLGEVVTHGAHFLDYVAAEVGGEGLHGADGGEGLGRREDAGLVVDAEHGAEEGDQELDCAAEFTLDLRRGYCRGCWVSLTVSRDQDILFEALEGRCQEL